MLLMAFLVIGIGLVNAQISKVTGHVTSDEDGLPVVGASVLVEGTTVGTVTDIDGNFTLTNVHKRAKFGENFGYFVHRLPDSESGCQIKCKCCFEI